MAEGNPGVTLDTLHDDLTAGFAGLKGEVRDLKATLVAGFRGLPGREASEKMIRLLREANRIQEERSTQLDLRIREQHLETQQVLHAIVEGQRVLVEGQRLLVAGRLFDLTQGYGVAILIAAGGNAVGVLVALGLPRRAAG